MFPLKSHRWYCSLFLLSGVCVSPCSGAQWKVSQAAGAAFPKISDALRVANPGDTILIAAGTYRESVVLKSGVRLEAEDPARKPWVSALEEVKGPWVLVDSVKRIYAVRLDAPPEDGEQIFVDGSWVSEARIPGRSGEGMNSTEATVPVSLDDRYRLTVRASLPSLSGADWAGARFVGRIDQGWCWQSSEVVSASMTATGTWSFQLKARDKAAPWWPNFADKQTGEGVGYWVGKKAFIGAGSPEAAWAVETVGGVRTLFLRLKDGGHPAGHRVERKGRTWCVESRGVTQAGLKNLRFLGGALRLDGEQLVVERCEVSHPSHFDGGGWYGSGKEHERGVLVSGKGNRIMDCLLERSAGAGVSVLGTGHEVLRNTVRDSSYAGTYYAPLDVFGERHRIAFNTVEGAGRDGIHLNGSGHEVHYNHVRNAGRVALDCAGIYSYGTDGKGAGGSPVGIAYNWVEGDKGVGVYLDNMSQNFRVQHNVLWDNAGPGAAGNFWGLHVNGPASGIECYHNTIVSRGGYGRHTYVDSDRAEWQGGQTHGVELKSYNNLVLTPEEARVGLEGFTPENPASRLNFLPKRTLRFLDYRLGEMVQAMNPTRVERSVHWIKAKGVKWPYVGTDFEWVGSWHSGRPKNGVGVRLTFGPGEDALPFFWRESFGQGRAVAGVSLDLVGRNPDAGAYALGVPAWVPGVAGRDQASLIAAECWNLVLPANRVVEATGRTGAVVSYVAPCWSGPLAGGTVTSRPASGSLFPLGVTRVQVEAVDGLGRRKTGSFEVRVVDSVAPELVGVPAVLSAEATGPQGAVVHFPVISMKDAVGGGTLTVVPASGSVFKVGRTTVSVEGRDGAGNRRAAQFEVRVAPGLVNVNGDIEAGLKEWLAMGVSAPLQIDSRSPHSGKSALRVSGRTEVWGSALQLVPVEAEQRYRVSAWVRLSEGGLPVTLEGTLLFKDGGRAWKGTLGQAVSRAGEWTRVEAEVQFSGGRPMRALQLSFGTGERLVDFSVDDVEVRAIP
ncbi:MAG: hypothetical protein RLZZ142_1048 [Verrucomicrobiota bacterium]